MIKLIFKIKNKNSKVRGDSQLYKIIIRKIINNSKLYTEKQKDHQLEINIHHSIV